MKIQKISWRNYKGLSDGEIDCGGSNVVISGRNGAGKSSIASIIPFVLFGKIDAKSFDRNGLPIKTQIPSATIEFDDGNKFRRDVTAQKNRTFVNGIEVSATEFNLKVLELTGGVGTLLLNPFEFPNLHWTKQRELLIQHFAENVQLPTTDEFKAELSQLKKDTADLPGRIAEILRQIDELPKDNVDELERILTDKQSELLNLQAKDFSREKKFLSEQLRTLERRREELLSRYRSTKTTCPTCGQKLPKSKIDAARNQIVDEGKQVSAEIERLKNDLATVQSKSESGVDRSLKIKNLQAEIRDITRKIATIQSADKLRERLARLTESEKSLNAKITELEGKIAQAQQLQRQQMAASENRVNQQFEFVTFKLFKLLANGELRETCEAMINGVPYSSLSKGEKLKAACDILRTLQNKFQIAMPLLLDDAESYTSNSLVDLPNQLFLFKVTEDDLKISVGEMRRAA